MDESGGERHVLTYLDHSQTPETNFEEPGTPTTAHNSISILVPPAVAGSSKYLVVDVEDELNVENEVEVVSQNVPLPTLSKDKEQDKKGSRKRALKRPKSTISMSTNNQLSKKLKQMSIDNTGKLSTNDYSNDDASENRSLFVKGSALSKYFKLVATSPDQPEHFQCMYQTPGSLELCGSRLSLSFKSGHSNLKKHMKAVHKVDLKQESDNPSEVKVTDLLPKQKLYPKQHPKQVMFEQSLIDMVCVGSQKLDMVHDVTFLRLVNILDPQISIRSRATLIRSIHEAATDVKVKIKEEIAQLNKNSIHVTCDIWTNRRRQGIFGVILHYINNSWEFQHKLVGFKVLNGSHTAANISEKFIEVVEEFGLKNEKEKIGFVTSDNAANMIAAFNLLTLTLEEDDFDILGALEREINADCLPEVNVELVDGSEGNDGPEVPRLIDMDRVTREEMSDVMSDISENSTEADLSSITGWVGCNSHTLQLAINRAIGKNPAVQELIKYVQSIMRFFKKSVTWSDHLRSLTSTDVVMPGKTRWNSTMDMIKRFLDEEFFNAVRTTLEHANQSLSGKRSANVPMEPNMIQKRQVQELYSLLKPFGMATDYLQTDGPSSGTFLLTMTHTYERLKKVNCSFFHAFKTDLTCEFMDRFSLQLQSEQWILAAFLDPRIKLTVFQAIHAGECGKDWSYPSLANITETIKLAVYVKQQIGVARSSLPRPASCDDMESNMFALLEPHAVPMRPEEEEYTSYSKEPVLKSSECPLKYWNQNCQRFPILADLARTNLGIPVTSATIERVYSIAGNYLRSRRARTTPKTIESMLLVRQHRKQICVQSYQKQ